MGCPSGRSDPATSRVGRTDGWSPVGNDYRIPLTGRLTIAWTISQARCPVTSTAAASVRISCTSRADPIRITQPAVTVGVERFTGVLVTEEPLHRLHRAPRCDQQRSAMVPEIVAGRLDADLAAALENTHLHVDRHTDARYEIMSFIEWYNHRRRHTSRDDISPVRYEENHHNSAHAASPQPVNRSGSASARHAEDSYIIVSLG